MAIGTRLLENRGSPFGVLLLQGILAHPGNSALPVCILGRHWPAGQTQQQTGSGQQAEEWTGATLPERKPAPLSNSSLLSRLDRNFGKLFSSNQGYPLSPTLVPF